MAEEDDAAMRARLDRLSGAIKAQRGDKPDSAEPEAKAPIDGGLGEGMSMAFRVVTELVAGICIGGGIGWLLDKPFHTKPLFLIVFGLLGTAAGFWNIIRATTPKGRAAAVDFRDRLGASRRGAEAGPREDGEK